MVKGRMGNWMRKGMMRMIEERERGKDERRGRCQREVGVFAGFVNGRRKGCIEGSSGTLPLLSLPLPLLLPSLSILGYHY